jgi:tRNA dimethylallyltransferase
MPKPLLIAVMGPTASGKTSLSIELAKHYSSPVLSFDSRQFYIGADIGTAKPFAAELAAVPHKFISHLQPTENYTAAEFESDALSYMENHFARQPVLVAAGGTGFYLRVLEHGLDEMPEVSEESRSRARNLYSQLGLSGLQEEIQKLDSSYYQSCDSNNHVRLIRALELMYASGKKVSELRIGKKKSRMFSIIKIMRGDFSETFRAAVYENIERRVRAMWSAGLLEEARRLLPYRDCQSMQTVGYRECFQLLDGEISESDCIEQIITHTRQYAKRQFTWLKKEQGLRLYPSASAEIIIKDIDRYMEEQAK